jgi:hypothetical protein
MALILPNPSSPTNGQVFDATPIFQNQAAITQSIQSFDASQIQAGTIAASALPVSINPVSRAAETIANFVSSGLIWSAVTGLNGTMSSGIVYIQGIRVPVTAVGSKTFTASQDTYVDVDYNGNVYYVAVANGATSGMTLTPNSIRIAKILTSASAITSVVQFNADPIGNIIYPTGYTNTLKIQNPYKFSAYLSTAITGLPSGAWVRASLNTVLFDTGSNFSISGGGRFVVPVAGFYSISAQIGIGSAGIITVSYAQGAIYKNGVLLFLLGAQIQGSGNGNTLPRFSGAQILQLNVGDFIELYGLCSDTSRDIVAGLGTTFMTGFLVSTS